MRFELTSPCHNCPFRTDIVFGLRPGRVAGIEKDVMGDKVATFSCHHTTNLKRIDQQHCAGALILMEKTKQSTALQLAERLGIYDPSKLKMDAPVYDTWSDAEAGQAREVVARKKLRKVGRWKLAKRSSARR